MKICHMDVNSAYLSWEAAYRRSLGDEEDIRMLTSAIGGDIKSRHGIILAKSASAKERGVKTGETIASARTKCPELLLYSPDYALYKHASDAFNALLREYTPLVEPYSIDESFVDLSFAGDDIIALCQEIRGRISKELGFFVNVGISENKVLAKMASELHNQKSIETLYPEELAEKLWPLPVGEMFMIGRRMRARLAELGIYTIGDLARADREEMIFQFGKYGEMMKKFASGDKGAPVSAHIPEEKSVGNSTTFAFDLEGACEIDEAFLSLAETVAARLRKKGKSALKMAVHYRDINLDVVRKERVLIHSVHETEEVHREAVKLLHSFWSGERTRSLGITVSALENYKLESIDVFTWQRVYAKDHVGSAIDALRARYGSESVFRACFLENRLKPAAGGVFPDKDMPIATSKF